MWTWILIRNINYAYQKLCYVLFLSHAPRLSCFIVMLLDCLFSYSCSSTALFLNHAPRLSCFLVILLDCLFSYSCSSTALSLNHAPRLSCFLAKSHAPELTFELSMISGARYQRVATYSVRNPVWSCSGSATRARPKSQICTHTN